jgi:hypothetical protein
VTRRAAGRRVLQGAGDSVAEAGVRVHAEDRALAEQLGQHGPAAILAAGVHPDDALRRVGLLTHRLDQARQQPGGVVSHHYGGDDVTRMRCAL